MVINEGMVLGKHQQRLTTQLFLQDVQLLPEMAARVRIAPRGWLQARQSGDITVTSQRPCCGEMEQYTLRFPMEFEATLCPESLSVILEPLPVQRWTEGLYEAQVILLYRGTEQPIEPVVLFEVA